MTTESRIPALPAVAVAQDDLKQLLAADNIDDKRWPARMLAGLIDGWKNRGLTPSQVPSISRVGSDPGSAKMVAGGQPRTVAAPR